MVYKKSIYISFEIISRAWEVKFRYSFFLTLFSFVKLQMEDMLNFCGLLRISELKKIIASYLRFKTKFSTFLICLDHKAFTKLFTSFSKKILFFYRPYWTMDMVDSFAHLGVDWSRSWGLEVFLHFSVMYLLTSLIFKKILLFYRPYWTWWILLHTWELIEADHEVLKYFDVFQFAAWSQFVT